MTNKNQVTLTFAGDDKDLERAFDSVQKGAAKTGDALAAAGKKADEATRGLGHVAEATDEVDTLGSKATSSLGALSSGLELVGQNNAAQGLMTASLATDALSGAGEAATLVTENLGKTVTKAKEAYAGLSTAAKVGVVSLGAVAAAAAAAGLIFLAFKQHQEEVKSTINDIAHEIDFQTGALDRNNRAYIANLLQQQGLLDLARQAGVSQSDLTTAIFKGGQALDELGVKQGFVNKNMTAQQVAMIQLAQGTHSLADWYQAAKQQSEILGSAVGDTNSQFVNQAVVIKNAQEALISYNQSLRDELDPMANLFHRLQDLKQAQADYATARKKHKADSPEVRSALIDEAQAVLDVRDAIAKAGGTFSGHFTPAMRDALSAAHFTAKQISDLEKALRDTKAAGDALNGKTFTFTTTEIRNIKTNRYARTVDVDGRASGGPVKAGKTYKVGEHGEELVTFGQDGYVHNAADSRAMLGGWSPAMDEPYGPAMAQLTAAARGLTAQQSTAGGAPYLPVDTLTRALRAALQGMAVRMDDREVGMLTGRTVDLYRRSA